MSDWRPIETAPKDGGVVDLWCKRNWNPPASHERVVDMHWDVYLKDWRGPALHYVQRLGSDQERGLTPVAWMPIPEPPK